MFKYKIKLFAVTSIVFLLISSCSQTATNTATSAPTVESTELPTLSPTNTPTQTPIAVATIHSTLTYQCLDIALSLPSNVKPHGKLVLAAQHPYLLDLDTGTKKALDNNQGQFRVSPDGKWVASQYMDHDNKFWLWLETADGIKQKPIVWKEDWIFLAGWLDNEHVWISHLAQPLVTVVNPFTGEQQDLILDFPGFETAAQAGEHFAMGAGPVLYDASLVYAIYPRLENDGYVYLVLWDRQANRVLARTKHLVKSFEYGPIWSLDQTQLYVPLIDKWTESKPNNFVYDFFSLGKDGQVQQLTNFGSIFNDIYIGSISLSPDGKKIAFWFHLGATKEQLAVLDLDTKQVTDYCIPGSYQNGAGSPVWSLDSHYLVVHNQYEPNAGRTILVDIRQGWAAQVAEIKPNGWPAGWMISP